MAKYTIDGLTYTDRLPHSRVERILFKILDNEGGYEPDLVVDDPSKIGSGLELVDDTIIVSPVNTVLYDNSNLISSHAVWEQLQLAGTIMATI